jgi:hypothetical protein
MTTTVIFLVDTADHGLTTSGEYTNQAAHTARVYESALEKLGYTVETITFSTYSSTWSGWSMEQLCAWITAHRALVFGFGYMPSLLIASRFVMPISKDIMQRVNYQPWDFSIVTDEDINGISVPIRLNKELRAKSMKALPALLKKYYKEYHSRCFAFGTYKLKDIGRSCQAATVLGVRENNNEVEVCYMDLESNHFVEKYELPPLHIALDRITNAPRFMSNIHNIDVLEEALVLDYNCKNPKPVTIISIDWHNRYKVFKELTKHNIKHYWLKYSTPTQQILKKHNMCIGKWSHGVEAGINDIISRLRVVSLSVSASINEDGDPKIDEFIVVEPDMTTHSFANIFEFVDFWESNTIDVVVTCEPVNTGAIAIIQSEVQRFMTCPSLYQVIRWPMVHWNVWDAMRKHHLFKQAYPEWTLDEVCKHDNIPCPVEIREFKRKKQQEGSALLRAQILMQIAQKHEIVREIVSLASVVGGISYCDIQSAQPLDIVRSSWHMDNNERLFPIVMAESKDIGGGYIEVSDSAHLVIKHPKVFDLKSAYPTQFINTNESPELCTADGSKIFSKDVGAVAAYMQSKMDIRDHYRRIKDNYMDKAVKLQMNSYFGICKLFWPDCAGRITKQCYTIIEMITEHMKDNMPFIEWICSHTDGIVYASNYTEKEEEDIELRKYIEDTFNFKNTDYTIECNMHRLLIKNANHWAWIINNVLHIKGLKSMQHTTPPLFRQFEKDLCNEILMKCTRERSKGLDEIKAEYTHKLLSASLKDLTIMHTVTEDSKTYKRLYVNWHMQYPWYALPGVVACVRNPDSRLSNDKEPAMMLVEDMIPDLVRYDEYESKDLNSVWSLVDKLFKM